jgi:phenylpropionate dioxygenase-like ring-hydroxylating dioxygenase large terminal subunit
MSSSTEMLSDLNQTTQPIRPQRVFNNWNVVSQGWYVVARSKELKKGKTLSKKICGQQLVLFRTESGKACALDAFCPHMGMDLAKGKVVGETVQCHFHHWKFSGEGQCTDIPCLKTVPEKRFNMQSYPVQEKYGLIWVYSDAHAPEPVFEIDDLKGDYMYVNMAPFHRKAHPHITMMNSIDEQHMRTIHLFDMNLKTHVEENGTRFKVSFSGDVLSNTLMGKIQTFFFGNTYRSSVLFVDGCLGLLTTMINVKLFNRFTMPRGMYIFSQTFTEAGKTVVHPIVVTERRKGLGGFLFSWTLLRVNKLIMKFLAFQDGRTIYGHIRFRQDGLLPGVDEASAKWISFTNRALKPSIWSRSRLATNAADVANTPEKTPCLDH